MLHPGWLAPIEMLVISTHGINIYWSFSSLSWSWPTVVTSVFSACVADQLCNKLAGTAEQGA